MNAAARLGVFAAVLAGVFAVAWGVGAAVDPITDPAPAASTDHGDDHGAPDTSADSTGVTGLALAADGVRLVPATDELALDTPAPYRFRIESLDDGSVVTDFDLTHEREMHLVVVSQDLAAFQHVHPVMDDDGTWSIDLAVPAPGAYRVYTEFQPSGRSDSTVLSTAAFAPGTPPAPPVHAEDRDARVDGYELTLDGALVPGTTSTVEISVRLDGEPVTDLQPYLGAAGHLVALRAGDQAYTHVHPVGETTAGPVIPFAIEVPSAGTYRLFLDFQHDGVVRTADFTVEVTQEGGAP